AGTGATRPESRTSCSAASAAAATKGATEPAFQKRWRYSQAAISAATKLAAWAVDLCHYILGLEGGARSLPRKSRQDVPILRKKSPIRETAPLLPRCRPRTSMAEGVSL